MKRKIAVLWLSLAMILTSVVILIEIAPKVKASTIWFVDDVAGSSGPDDPAENFTSIQEAINNAINGDTIFVYNGTYYENVVINKIINLTGEDRNNTIIDGNRMGHVIKLTAGGVNISGFTITNGFNGIRAQSSNNNIVHNIFSFNRYSGIYIDYSGGQIIKENIMIEDGILIDGPFLENWDSHDIDISNTVNGKPVYYWKYQTGGIVPSGAGQIILAKCTDITIEKQELTHGSAGLELGFCSNITITNNNISNNDRIGIYLVSSNGNNITSNNVASNRDWEGIALGSSNGNVFLGNNITQNRRGISLFSSTGNNITGNKILSNMYQGIYLHGSYENNIIDNNVSSNGLGFDILFSNNNNIKNNTILINQYEGIYSLGSVGVNVIDNNISFNKYYGISLGRSSYYTILNNTMIDNSIIIGGEVLEHFNTHYIDTSNTVNGKPIYYWKNRIGGAVPIDAGEVILANCTNVIVKNQEITNGTVGIELGFSSNNNIIGNDIINNYYGIWLLYSDENNITGNDASSNRLGIGSRYSKGNNITLNHVSLNEGVGIYIRGSLNNHIFHNNIINNIKQAYDDSNNKNQWDNGYPSGGNFWSDYNGIDNFSGPGQNISGSDGIGDEPYVIDSDSSDNYPLLKSVEEVLTPLPPPTLFINISPDGKDVILYWNPPPAQNFDPYLIYRSTDPTNFDFTKPWVNTLTDKEPGELNLIPDRTMWNDTNAAFPGNESKYEEQYYYTIRAFNDRGEVSRTSRTVGKWTKTFPKGVSTFSLPLEPIDTLYIDNLTTNMNADYIKYMDPINHTWRQHKFGDGNINNTQMKLGEGYEVKFSNQTNYTFIGLPGAMISYNNDRGFQGFNPSNEAKNLTVSIESDGNVTIYWQEPVGMSSGGWYEVYYSHTRDGFFGTYNTDYFLACTNVHYGNNTATHHGAQANNPGARLYYMIVPFNSSGVRGSSTYSIGIWTEEILAQYDTFGIPLKLNYSQTADWYCDQIDDVVGINYFIYTDQRWGWHSTRMPAGAYDPLLLMTEGYQISTSSATKFTFIGV